MGVLDIHRCCFTAFVFPTGVHHYRLIFSKMFISLKLNETQKKFTKLKNWWILKSYYMKSSTHGSEKNILMSGRYIWSIWSRLHFRYHTLRNSRVVGVVNATFFFVESKNSYPFVFRRLRGSSEIADC